MAYGEQELKLAALLDALEEEHARVQAATAALKATGEDLRRDVQEAAASSMQAALKSLKSEIEAAHQVVNALSRFSLGRAAWQHVIVALVAIVVALLAVWLYVPSLSEIQTLRTEQAQLTATIAELTERGGKMQLSRCGPDKRLCVAVDERAGKYGRKGDSYLIAKGY